MPVYYLNIRHGAGFIQDVEGVDLPDLEAVVAEALRSAKSVTANRLSQGLSIEGLTFEIAEESGTVVAEIPFDTGLLRRLLDRPNAS
jgi:hypothetical protein